MYTWQNLQQNYMQQMWDLFVERRYKFQNEIQFSSNSIMEHYWNIAIQIAFVIVIWVASTKSSIIGLLLARQVFANITVTA